MKVSVYNQKAENVGSITLPAVFDVEWKPDVVSFIYEGMMRNRRYSSAHAKGRGEVRGGGRKPWRQKGTGRARHGSIRSPLWRGGGVTHGPVKDRVYSVKLNRKMKRNAFQSVLAKKMKDKEIFVFESLSIADGRTKSLISFLERIEKKFKIRYYGDGSNTLIIVAKKSLELGRAASNIPRVSIKEARSVSVIDMLHTRYILLEKEALQYYGAV